MKYFVPNMYVCIFGAIHRNSSGSGLFIQAINSRFENLNKVSCQITHACKSIEIYAKLKFLVTV